MLDRKQTGNVAAKGSLRVLKLNRETLRELDAGERLQCGKRTYYCFTDFNCTRACPKTIACGG